MTNISRDFMYVTTSPQPKPVAVLKVDEALAITVSIFIVVILIIRPPIRLSAARFCLFVLTWNDSWIVDNGITYNHLPSRLLSRKILH